MSPALRSFLRTLLFAVAPVVVAFAADAVWLGEIGVPPEVAVVVAALVGAIARAFLPNVFGTRPEA